MSSIKSAFKTAKKEKPGYEIQNAMLYKDYCVVFMQPEGTPDDPFYKELDCYIFVNLRTGKSEPHTLYEFDDFFTKSEDVRM